jgi:hypothetical protein
MVCSHAIGQMKRSGLAFCAPYTHTLMVRKDIRPCPS